MAEELLEKIPPEKRWEVTAKMLLTISVLRGVKTVMPLLGKEEGIVSPVWGWEKFQEIMNKIYVESGKKLYRFAKETFNIPVEDSIGASKLRTVVIRLQSGPEYEGEYVEKTPERTVFRWTKCAWLERYRELEVDPEFIMCPSVHQLLNEEGLKAINPKITFKRTTAMPGGDPYCEDVFEFKEE